MIEKIVRENFAIAFRNHGWKDTTCKTAAKIQKNFNISIKASKIKKKVINLHPQKRKHSLESILTRMKKLLSISLLTLCLVLCQWVSAQTNTGILPKSAVAQLSESTVPQYDVATPDLGALLSKSEASSGKDGTPMKVGVTIPTHLTTNNAGVWETTEDGYDIWRLKMHNDNALGCCILFDRFMLPEGAQFFVYNLDKSLIYGPYTNEYNPSGKSYSSGLFADGDVILEYISPKHQLYHNDNPDIVICGYHYIFRPDGLPDYRVSGPKDGDTGYGAAQSCMINVNCSEGDNWRTQQKGVMRLYSYFNEGSVEYAGWCSGTLINNTMGDGTPYFLTANHCADNTTASQFNRCLFFRHYECPSCTCYSEPAVLYYTGCTKIANSPINGGSDFLLLRLNGITNWYKLKQDGMVLNGWNKAVTPSSSGVSIHHPAGDVKKISTYNSTLTSGTFVSSSTQETGATNAYWIVPWAQTTHGRSVTEGGSSGSPLFNSVGLVVGTLTGGSSSCDNPSAREYYGKMSYHWTSAGSTNDHRLQPWLDPVPQSQSTCNYLDPNGSFFTMPSAHIFNAGNSSYSYIVYSNEAWTLSYQGDHSWFTVNNESGTGNSAITVTCQPNPNTTTRRCTMIITQTTSGATWQVTVKQEASASGIAILPEKEFTIYPNPAHDQINIESVEHFINKVEILDMLGKVVYSYNTYGANSLTLPISQLNDAMYLMRLTTVDNEVVYKKFSKN